MATHGGGNTTIPESPEALLADRERMWSGFTTATTVGACFTALLLVAMAVFLL